VASSSANENIGLLEDLGQQLDRLRSTGDPYPLYDLLRTAGPVLWLEQLGYWVVVAHREVLTVLRDPRLSSDRSRWDAYKLPPGEEQPAGGMVVMDPPDHTRLRGLVQQAFTPRVLELLRPRIEELVDRMLTAAAELGGFDLMADLAAPLPATVLAELLGVPPEDQELFRRWATAHIESIDPVSHAVSEDGMAARATLRQYLEDIVAQRRRRPQEDLISGLLQAQQEGDRLDGRELMEMLLLLLVAGIETTANLIGNGMNALFDHPAELDRLRAEPGLIESAIEELVRYDAPIQLSGRVPVEDVELAGHTLRKGQMVGVILGAANRDPMAFREPNRLDLARSPNPHVAFGRGIHFCIGAPMARIEGQIAIPALLARFPGLHRAGEARMRENLHVRGFSSLPVAF
jgi:pimeloyl-[acyl-carrier protein] synthase